MARMRPEAVTGAKGYSATEPRGWLNGREAAAVLPTRANEQDFDDNREAYQEWPLIERTIYRRKSYRRIARRKGQLASSFPAMVSAACIPEWLQLRRRNLEAP